jgi:hypothetical protein
MPTVKIVDKDGEWYVNRSQYPMYNPERNLRFDPQVAVQIRQDKWMKTQPVIVKVEDPNEEVEPIIGEDVLRGDLKASLPPGTKPTPTSSTVPPASNKPNAPPPTPGPTPAPVKK